MWALIAEHSGVVEAWRLMGVCKAAREGAKKWLGTLPGLVVCGGLTGCKSAGRVSAVWRLGMATLRWESMPGLRQARSDHVCCTVRGALIVLGGRVDPVFGCAISAEVEMLSEGDDAFVTLPPMSCGGIAYSAALVVNETHSEKGQVLLLGGYNEYGAAVSTVHLVDLATGESSPQPPQLIHRRAGFAAAHLLDGRIICAGRVYYHDITTRATEVLELSDRVAPEGAWRQLPPTSVGRGGGRGCVMTDGRFAVFGGMHPPSYDGVASCEALVLHEDDAHTAVSSHWEPLSPMLEPRAYFASAAFQGCIVVAGGCNRTSCELYEEASGRWRRLPWDLPGELYSMGSTAV